MHRLIQAIWLLMAIGVCAASADTVDLLVVGGNEAACAAALQAARLGVGSVALVSDIDMLGGQFSAEGVGPVDERIKLDGHSVNFPRSGMALEVIRAIRAYNMKTYGRETPGNCWSATDTIEPAAAARIFEELLAPQVTAGRLHICRGYEPIRVLKEGEKVVGVVFVDAQGRERSFSARLTIDASDWGDVIRLGGIAHFSGVDPVSRFGEKGEPQEIGIAERQEMNPITYTITLRESDQDCAIERPEGYDMRNYHSDSLEDFGILPEPYPPSIRAHAYNQRRLVDRVNYGFKPGTETIQLNTMTMDYPLVDLPATVRVALERTEKGASEKNIVEMTPAQRRIIFDDAKRRSLGFLYYLQNDCPATTNIMRRMALVDDFGTPDKLPPKPYVREGLRLDALTVVTANDVRAADEASVTWAPTRPVDAAFGFQFHIDFHPTRRQWVGPDHVAWHPRHSLTRSWDQFTHRAFVPLRAFVPKRADGLLGAGKNIGMSSVVEAALRLHPQMLLSGQASGTLAAQALLEGRSPREVVNDCFAVRRICRALARGVCGMPGVAIYAWQDLMPEDPCFEAANVLPAIGKWDLPKTFFFHPDEIVIGRDGKKLTRRELAIAMLRELDASGNGVVRGIAAAKQLTSPLPTLADVRAWAVNVFGRTTTLQSERVRHRLEIAERLDRLPIRTKLAEAERQEFLKMFAEMQSNLTRDPSFPGVDAVRLDVRSFGAVGDGIADDMQAFARVAAKVRTLGGLPVVVDVPKGTYLFASTVAPVIGKPVHVDFSGITNCWIRGESPETVKFVFGVYDRSGISLNRSSNTTLSGVDCAYQETPFSQCRLESYDAVSDSAVVVWCPGTLRPDSPRFASRRNPQICGIFTKDGKKDRREGGSPRYFNLKADNLGKDRYRIYFARHGRADGEMFVAEPGSYIVIPDRDNSLQGANAFQSRHCTFDNVWFCNARSSAITGFGAAYMTLNRCRVLPGNASLVFSANADTCFCVRGAYLANCDFGGMNDDGANCLGHGTLIKAKRGEREIEVEEIEGRIMPGDVVQVVRSLDGRFMADLTVESISGTRLRFRENLPDGLATVAENGGLSELQRRMVSLGLGHVDRVADLLYAPLAWGTGFVAVSNRIHDLRGNGINVQCPHALVEGNVFERIGCGVKLSGLNNWFEGTPPYDVVVRGNRFVDCETAIHSVYTDINARASVDSPMTDIEITGNEFENVNRNYHLLNLNNECK